MMRPPVRGRAIRFLFCGAEGLVLFQRGRVLGRLNMIMSRCMNTIIRDLIALQQILQCGANASAEAKAQAANLEKGIPPPLLAHFSRQLACDRHGAAHVRNGICCACHIRVPSVTLDDLGRTDDVLLCENCGCYLAPPPDEELFARETPPVPAPVVRRRGRRKLTAVVV